MSRRLVARLRTMRSDEGATPVEYGLLVALVAAVVIAIVATLGGQVFDAFTVVSEEMPVAP